MPLSIETDLVDLANRRLQKSQWVVIVLVLSAGIAGYIAVLPYVGKLVSPALGTIAMQSVGLAITNLLTALLLLGQLQLRRSVAVSLLSFGYFVSSVCACVYTFLFPELIAFSEVSESIQLNDWLYLIWHGTFSLAVLGYALTSMELSGPLLRRQLIVLVFILSVAGVAVLSGLDTIVPALAANRHAANYEIGISVVILISLWGFAAVLAKRPCTLLDGWLSVAMLTWIFDVALATSFENQSFDLGFYVGRLASLLGSILMLGILGMENLTMNARLRAAVDSIIEVRVREKSNTLLAAVLRKLPEGVFVFDESRDSPIINERGMALISTRATGNEGGHGNSSFMDLVVAQARRVGAQGSFEGQIMELFDDDAKRVVSVSGTAIHDAAGGLAAKVVVVNDVTERIQADQALQRYLARLRALLENTPLTAVEWDRDRIVRRWSKRAEELFGYSAAEVIGKSIDTLKFVHPDDIPAVHAIAEALISGEANYIKSENRNLTRDGRVIECEWHNSVLRDESGEVDALFSLALDITERKTAMEQVKEAEQRKDTFIATLAHELRNPLAPIANAASLLLSQGADPARVTWIASMISRQSTRMARLLDDLLDVSRISRGKIQLRKELVDMTSLVHEALQVSMPLLEAARHHVEVKLPDGPIWVNADPVRIAQIMSNLLNNSAKYTPPGGRIEVQLQAADQSCAFIVRDNGIGIESKMLPHVFEAFVQVGSARHLAQGGLGIGLSLSRGLAELHGGTLTVKSEGKNKGCTFTFDLPLAANQQAAFAPSTNDAATSKLNTTILVADDNVDAADSLALLLRARGADVAVAYDGDQALQMFSERRFDVAILDLGMPCTDGLQVARQLTLISPRPFLIALTGRARKEDLAESASAGFDEHLIKPVDPEHLVAVLRRVSS